VEKTIGILLRKRRFSETSLIIHWCTIDEGIVHTVARGASRPKSPMAGKLDLFYTTEFSYRRSRSSDLHNLGEVAVQNHRRHLQADYIRVVAASHFVRMVELVAERDTPIPEIYELLTKALDFLDDPTSKVGMRVVERFELRLTEFLGIARPDRQAHQVISETFGRLPSTRDEVTERLN